MNKIVYGQNVISSHVRYACRFTRFYKATLGFDLAHSQWLDRVHDCNPSLPLSRCLTRVQTMDTAFHFAHYSSYVYLFYSDLGESL